MASYMDLFDTCVFAFDGKNSILEDKDIGICADIASMLTPPSSVTAMHGFQGCPYTNTAFDFEGRIDGEKVTDAALVIEPARLEGEGIVVKKGKKVYHKITLA